MSRVCVFTLQVPKPVPFRSSKKFNNKKKKYIFFQKIASFVSSGQTAELYKCDLWKQLFSTYWTRL